MEKVINSINVFDSIDKIDQVKWRFFIENNLGNNIFQTLELYNFLNKQKNYEPFIYFFESQAGECLAFCSGAVLSNGKFLIKNFSRRAIIFDGPLFSENLKSKIALKSIIEIIQKKLRRNSIYTEIRNLSEKSYYKDAFLINEWDYLPYQDYIINLTTEEEVFSAFHNERRRQIRKALREGVQYDYSKSKENIIGVYNILFKVYVERVNKPLPNLEFFLNLMLLDSSGIITIIYQNEIIGGGFFLFDDHTIYNWYRGCLDTIYKHQYPSCVADWGIMKFGIEKRLKKYDYMGAGLKGVDYGVRNYKSKFGGELVEYGRFVKVNKPIQYYMALRVLEKMQKNHFTKRIIAIIDRENLIIRRA